MVSETKKKFEAFIKAAGEDGFVATSVEGTLWQEASLEHSRISKTNITVIFENPDGRDLCVILLGGNPEARAKLQGIWDKVGGFDEEEELGSIDEE